MRTQTLRDAAKQVGADTLDDGSWFRRLIARHVKKHFAAIDRSLWDRMYPGLDTEERAHRHVKRTARRTAGAGALAGVGASSGELLALVTEGLAAPVGVPAAVASMLAEAWYTALAQIDLACDLASIYGVPFDSDDVGEVATLFGLALDVDVKAKKKEEDEAEDEDGPDKLSEKLLELKEGDIASRIGRKMLEESVMRNVVPFLSVPISARWNYVGTKKLGAAVRKYMRYRRALDHSFRRLRLDDVANPSLLLEGAWLLATVDGEAGHEEMLALALLMDKIPEEAQSEIALDKTFGDDEEEWFEELAAMPVKMQNALIDTLSLIAATDRDLQPGERRFLRRVGKVLGREVDCAKVVQMARYFAGGEDVPPGMLASG